MSFRDGGITEKLRKLQVLKDVDQINSLVEKMEQSAYISSTTRSRVVRLLQHANMKSPSIETIRLIDIFHQLSSNYIRRCDVRRVIFMLKEIQSDQGPIATLDTENWLQEQWFYYLVDSGCSIVEPLLTILNNLMVCRRNVAPSSFTILLFGKNEENQFFQDLRQVFNADDTLRTMTDDIMRKLFNYSGGITITGSLDCLHVISGSCVESTGE